MRAISYTLARNNLAKTMTKVCDNHDPVMITRKNQQAVIMLSVEDYEALQETSYLLKSPRNAQRLLKSVDELNRGKGKRRSLVQ